MKTIYMVILFFMYGTEESCCETTLEVSSAQLMDKEWIISEGWIGTPYMKLEKLNKNKHVNKLYNKVEFKDNDSLHFAYYYLSTTKEIYCAMGVWEINKASWQMNNDELIIYAKGYDGSNFEYKTVYAIEVINENNVFLKREKNLIAIDKRNKSVGILTSEENK